MKISSVGFLLSIGVACLYTTLVDAGPADTCDVQKNCIKITVQESDSDVCQDGTCEFQVCMTRDNNECEKSNADTFSHICEKDSNQCSADLLGSFESASEVKSIDYNHVWCQIAGPNQDVEFLVKDGSGCGRKEGSYDISGDIFGETKTIGASCKPRPETIPSCTGNAVGKECIWTYRTPECKRTETSTPTVSPTKPDAPTAAPTKATDAPTTAPTKPDDPTGAPTKATDAPTTAPTKPDDPTGAPTKATDAPTTAPSKPDAPSPTKAPVASPTAGTPSPTKSPTGNTSGDPHFTMFTGKKFDFHGECDIVFVNNPDYNNGQGMRIHIRTKQVRWWSYVQSAVVQIGDDTLEVRGGLHSSDYWVNGVKGSKLVQSKIQPFTIGGHRVRFRVLSDITFQYKIFLDDEKTDGTAESIVLRSVKDWMKIDLVKHNEKNFGTSVGILGDYTTGEMLGRDGKTVFNDTDAYGLEWQVKKDEPMLFHNVEGPQDPEQCKMPSPATIQRRLGENTISRETAAKACAHVDPSSLKDCIFDVMATSDVDMAAVY